MNSRLEQEWQEFVTMKFNFYLTDSSESLIEEFDRKMQGRGPAYEISEGDINAMVHDLIDIEDLIQRHFAGEILTTDEY
ncbi:MAG: hypothetical protein LC687_02570 [Actinobacteria bacterium]|nr:hypothetical protein [Actinomycetota bacterium]MCA1806736.1 hypothetical protein [Actinomycetota bacterium]